MSSKDFSQNIGPRKTSRKKKPSDAEIEKVLESPKEKSTDTGQTTINIRMPKSMYDKLKKTAKETGVSMSSIIKQGITAELKRLNQ